MTSFTQYQGLDATLRGYMDSVGIYVRGLVDGGVANNWAVIQSAINAAASVGGGRVYLPYGNFAVGQTIVMSAKHNVYLIGQGSSPFAEQATILKYTGTAGSPLVYAVGTTAGIGLIGLALNGNGLANRSLDWNDCASAYINTIDVYGATADQIWFDATAASIGFQLGVFDNITATATGSAKALTIGPGTASWNFNFNVFRKLRLIHANGTALEINNADSNTFYGVLCQRAGTGNGIDLMAGAVLQNCRANKIWDVQSDGPITLRTGTVPAKDIQMTIITESGGATPTFEAGCTGVWRGSAGQTVEVFSDSVSNTQEGTGAVAFGSTLDLVKSTAGANAKIATLRQDTSGNLLIGTTSDDRSVFQTAIAVVRSGTTTTQVQLKTNDAERLRAENERIVMFKPFVGPTFAAGTLPTPSADLGGAYATRTGTGPVYCDGTAWYPMVLNTGGGPVT